MLDNDIKSSILYSAKYNLMKTAKRLCLDETMLKRLAEPKEKVEITIHPQLSGGNCVQIKVFIVRHRDSLGPAKGGIRMSRDVAMQDIEGLAMEMTWKTSLIGVPFGGGKSGICIDPSGLSEVDKEIIIRSYARSAMRHIGPEIYIPAPDIGTNEEDMGHIRDCIAYSSGKSITSGCYVTGKPVILGGVTGRKEATGKGVVFSTLAACEKLSIDISKCTVAVQGFGNVGSVTAKAISDCGAKVIAVSDISGGTINRDGLDISRLLRHVKQSGKVKGFVGGSDIPGEELIGVDCDILIPAATDSQITGENCDIVKARIIAEGANSPTEPEADSQLNKRGLLIIPDILCNAGGVFVSYLEYTQETQREQIAVEEINERLKKQMFDKFEQVYKYSKENGLTMREAAMEIAVTAVVKATCARGMLP